MMLSDSSMDYMIKWNGIGFYYLYVEVASCVFSDYFDADSFNADVRQAIKDVDSVISVEYEGELEVCIDDSVLED